METRRLNGLEEMQVVCGTPACLGDGRFDIVVANIERDSLLQLMPRLARSTASGGSLILSGLLTEQADSVASAGRKEGHVELARRTEGEWTALLLAPRPGIRPTVLVEEVEVSGKGTVCTFTMAGETGRGENPFPQCQIMVWHRCAVRVPGLCGCG